MKPNTKALFSAVTLYFVIFAVHALLGWSLRQPIDVDAINGSMLIYVIYLQYKREYSGE